MSILRKKFLILIISLISFNNVILAMNKRFDKSSKGSPSIAPKIRKSDNDWHPISYNTEIDHSLENESKTKDISDKSTQFFHDITGTQSPYDKDIKSLANRGLKLIKEQELEDKYKNLKELETYNNGGAALSLKIPNNNFNKQMPYGFVDPSNYENEQNIEQAQHHHSYQSQHPYSHNVQHHQPQHYDTGVIPYTNPDTATQQDNYYQIPNQFAPHFEALTQARENAKSNYHNQNNNPNQNQPRHQTVNPQSNSYDIGIQQTFQPSTQFVPSPGQHYNENVNEFSPSNVPHNQVHIQKFPSHPSDSYSHQQLYDGNPNENSPHFEALTAEKPLTNHSVRNQSSKKKKNNKKQNYTQHYGTNHEPSSTSSNCDDNSCERHNSQEYSNSFSTKSPHKTHHNSKKNHHHNHHSHETPDMITLLNHKIYHDDEENLSKNSSPEDHSNHNSYQHSSHHNSSKGKRSKKSKKPKRHHNGNGNSKLTHSMHSTQHPNEQYQMSEHPHNGRSYQVFEYPQESRITERIVEPLNDTTPNSDIEKSKNHHKFNKKFEGQQQQLDKEIKHKNQKSRQTQNKNNKNKMKNYDENVNATNTNNSDSKNYTPSPEYKFLINYRDENERSDKNVHENDASKNPSAAVDKEIRYFQDIYLAKKEPKYIEMGHKIENPEYLEERFEENDRKNQQFRGSVKWVNGNDEQGQQLWDLGH